MPRTLGAGVRRAPPAGRGPALSTPFLPLCGAAALAGALDAVVGGGGLVQLPALLVALPGTPVVALLGTNKLASVVGTASAAVTYARRVPFDRATAVPMAAARSPGRGSARCLPARSRGGAQAGRAGGPAGRAGRDLAPPGGGRGRRAAAAPGRARWVTVGAGAGIGLYDGLIGPGTGTFLVFLLVSVVGQSFLRASATAKAVNAATNLAALALFAAGGHVLWALGAAMAVSNLAGAQVGARLAVRRGSAWVRRVFLVVVLALVVRLALDVL